MLNWIATNWTVCSYNCVSTKYVYKSYVWYVYKQDWVLNNLLEGLRICKLYPLLKIKTSQKWCLGCTWCWGSSFGDLGGGGVSLYCDYSQVHSVNKLFVFNSTRCQKISEVTKTQKLNIQWACTFTSMYKKTLNGLNAIKINQVTNKLFITKNHIIAYKMNTYFKLYNCH